MPTIYSEITPEGPIIQIMVGVSTPQFGRLTAAGRTVPKPFLVRMLVDTGAMNTSIDAEKLAKLGLAPMNRILMQSASSGNEPVLCDQYEVCLGLISSKLLFSLHAVPVIATGPLGGTIEGLLGRDVLTHCLLCYHGENGTFSLSF